jgi:hypothetical protein
MGGALVLIAGWVALVLLLRYILLCFGPEPVEIRDLLRHPSWQPRCQCRRYGLPAQIDYIRDEWGFHHDRLCQPEAEMADPPGAGGMS